MTVAELRKALRRFPADALVVWQDHDNTPEEIASWPKFVDAPSDELLAANDLVGRAVVVLRG